MRYKRDITHKLRHYEETLPYKHCHMKNQALTEILEHDEPSAVRANLTHLH